MVGERIKRLRKEKGMSLENLADAIGTSRQTIHRYETGAISNIPFEKVEAIAKALCTTPSSLMGWNDDDYFHADNTIAVANLEKISTKSLPMLGNVACGEPIFASEEHNHYVKASDDVDADFCLTAKGDSMINARIFDGDILFVKKQSYVEDGEIAVVLIDDEATVKRVYFDRDYKILTLVPENPTYRPMRYMGSKLESIRILGKVVSGQYKI